MCAGWIPISGSRSFGLAPGEPAAELVGVKRVGVPGVPGQVGHRGTLGRCHRIGLEQKKRRSGHGIHLARETSLATDRRTRSKAPAPTLSRPCSHARVAADRRTDGERAQEPSLDIRGCLSTSAGVVGTTEVVSCSSASPAPGCPRARRRASPGRLAERSAPGTMLHRRCPHQRAVRPRCNA
jgi:hypothetical protein